MSAGLPDVESIVALDKARADLSCQEEKKIKR